MFHNIYKKNAAYIKTIKKSPNNLKIMDSDKLSLAHINAKKEKSNQVHIILHACLFFVKYILVRKYILNYKLKK